MPALEPGKGAGLVAKGERIVERLTGQFEPGDGVEPFGVAGLVTLIGSHDLGSAVVVEVGKEDPDE